MIATITTNDIQVHIAPAPSAETLAYIGDNIRHAGYYRQLTKCAQGLGYDSLTDAMGALAKRRATTVDTPKFRKLLTEWWVHAGSEDEHAAKVALEVLIEHINQRHEGAPA